MQVHFLYWRKNFHFRSFDRKITQGKRTYLQTIFFAAACLRLIRISIVVLVAITWSKLVVHGHLLYNIIMVIILIIQVF